MAWNNIKETYREAPNKYSCLSTDQRDTIGVPEGSTLYEVQPDGSIKIYKFLQADWRELGTYTANAPT